ncbi:uncharacterized protein PAC_16705 [Phialocephala subalpina]|uniref:Tyrosinase copper-binding domain-containing protein n=1 Tax=Phialocephala subalpina TaxID=576137 RepID=A0A1L7XP55_9HELO|nr:uncharacterized protein PAC_16705 [Phialocephala subalpina]
MDYLPFDSEPLSAAGQQLAFDTVDLQAGTTYAESGDILPPDPSFLQNHAAMDPAISQYRSVHFPMPNGQNPMAPQALALEMHHQWADTALAGVGINDTLACPHLQFNDSNDLEHNSNNTFQGTCYPSISYKGGDNSQLMFGPLATNDEASEENPQVQPKAPQNQRHSGFEGVIEAPYSKQHSAEQWQSVKPLIEELYVYKNMTLEKVQKVMEREHDFRASRNGKEVDFERYLKRAKITEYDLMDLSDTDEVPRGVELRTPSPSNDSVNSPSVLQIRDKILAAFREATACWKTTVVVTPWTAARFHGVNGVAYHLDHSYRFLTRGHTQDFGVMLRLAFARITETFDAMSPTCVLSFVLRFHLFPHAGMSDVIWRYLACLTRKRYSEFHPVHIIFSSIYRLLQRHGFAVYQDLLTECVPTIVDVLIGAYNLMDPYVVDSVLDLAVFFGYRGKYQLEKVLDGLKVAETTAKTSKNPVERLVVRSYIEEILALIEDGTTKTSRLLFLEECLQHLEAAALCDPTNPRINNLKAYCLASLALLHRIFCENSPTTFNPRYELARHFMERAICGGLDDFGVTNLTDILLMMERLLDWHVEAGDSLRVEDMRRRRDNALRLLQKLEEGVMDDDDSIISDIDSLRPSV